MKKFVLKQNHEVIIHSIELAHSSDALCKPNVDVSPFQDTRRRSSLSCLSLEKIQFFSLIHFRFHFI